MVKRPLLTVLSDALRDHIGDLADLPDSVWKRTGALNTWGTNAIEGNTLTEADVEALLIREESVSGRPVPDVVETLQHEAAFRGLLGRRKKTLELVTVLELHEEVFRGTRLKRAGHWRTSNVFITGTTHVPPRREKVVSRMETWLNDYRRRLRAKEDAFSLAAWAHHEFESIHPFEDGNGRAGRLILNLHFLKCGWPPLHVLPKDRDEYLEGLEAGHAKDYAPLQYFLEVRMARSLLDLLDQVGSERDELKPLKEFTKEKWNPYGAHYLSLRAGQGALPAIHVDSTSALTGRKRARGRPMWLTSETALRAYVDETRKGS
ncbi:MAG: Fic family protein [Euryarchaeota archaeon]|nr:Fic family protein [Euryarchaeota archaeon]